ncbi:MAG: ETC complex I subunit [Rhodobacterales bacterium]|nr:ETC complex I subunit [Rhodobacterales bacterium]
MSKVRIYQPTKNAMQSGRRNTLKWRLEYAPGAAKSIDPLMGWVSTRDMRRQVRMSFDSREAAIAFAERNGLEYEVEEPRARKVKIKNYADNFSYDRIR